MVLVPVGRGFEGAVTLELGGVLWTGDPPPSHPEASCAKQTPMANRRLTCSVIENIRSSGIRFTEPLNYSRRSRRRRRSLVTFLRPHFTHWAAREMHPRQSPLPHHNSNPGFLV